MFGAGLHTWYNLWLPEPKRKPRLVFCCTLSRLVSSGFLHGVCENLEGSIKIYTQCLKHLDNYFFDLPDKLFVLFLVLSARLSLVRCCLPQENKKTTGVNVRVYLQDGFLKPDGNRAVEAFGKRRRNLKIDWANCQSITFKQTSQIIFTSSRLPIGAKVD